MIEQVDLTSGGWSSIILVVGFFFAALASGFIHYLYKKTSRLQADYESLRLDMEKLKEESRKQEERHRQDRESDYRMINRLQNFIVDLQVYAARLRGMLAEKGQASPAPPVLDDVDLDPKELVTP
ncbi:hypothetical protein L3Y25_gp037 [Gordonia phage Syleon]|uniref:Membrane protein n=3 Tax=Octobienvirus TaxID=3044779 RepID=A0AAE8Y675_9CAUD|nr:membrane protein [Gordonia Phage Sephiroth]YP_010246555.1 membrane protein [Gordonia phage Kudefre]YP_010246696.1 hypothetical protein L3Y25_gp037 [Gordonia phage Syleon]QGH75766.1 hypothetical protein SEA_SYLEON_37 [Gordonia phage Syleon]QNN99381.1 membrane protein [Gordonia Phage Sephiroth]UDL15270.1 membrane protein [Gordonia phage Kudefre]